MLTGSASSVWVQSVLKTPGKCNADTIDTLGAAGQLGCGCGGEIGGGWGGLGLGWIRVRVWLECGCDLGGLEVDGWVDGGGRGWEDGRLSGLAAQIWLFFKVVCQAILPIFLPTKVAAELDCIDQSPVLTPQD